MNIRIGHGYDVHKLVSGRKLILGGVTISHDKGLLGHSDADVLIHALIDAMLGALALGDIGKHFPDNDIRFKDANSIYLLQNVFELISASGYELSNADITVIVEKPKIAEYIPMMRKTIAATLKTNINNISIKATTEEGLGFSGQQLGIACHAVILLQKKYKT